MTERATLINFQETYAGLSDDELLMVAASRRDLVQEAVRALDAEMIRRKLSYQEARAKKRETAQLEIEEARKHRSSRKGSKYFVYKANGWMPLFVAVGVPLSVFVFLSMQLVSKVWEGPIWIAAVSAGCVVTSVQPWLRKLFSFWLSLGVAFVIQLLVGYWLSVHLVAQTVRDLNWVEGFAIIPGYAIGMLAYFLLRKSGAREDS